MSAMPLPITLYPSAVSTNPGSWAAVGGGVEILSDGNPGTYYWKGSDDAANYTIYFDVEDLPPGTMAPFSDPEFYGHISIVDGWTTFSYVYLTNSGDTARTLNVLGERAEGGAPVYTRNQAWHDLQPDIYSGSPFTFTTENDVNEKKIRLTHYSEPYYGATRAYEAYWRITAEIEEGGFAYFVASIVGAVCLGGSFFARDISRICRSRAFRRRIHAIGKGERLRMLKALNAFPWRRYCFLGGYDGLSIRT